MTHVIRHARDDQGWSRAKFAPIDSSTWDRFDREWIQWMKDRGETVVTIGDTMYQITTPKE